MKKLYTILTMLMLICAAGAAAETVTVRIVGTGTNEAPSNYGTNLTSWIGEWTSNAASGMAGLKLTSSYASAMNQATVNNQRAMVIKCSAQNTADVMTIEAPAGYVITGYSFQASMYNPESNTEGFVLNINGTDNTVNSTTWNTYSESNIYRQKTTFSITPKISDSNNRWFCISNFTVTLLAVPAYDSNYTQYEISYSTGTFSRTDNNSSENSNNTWVSSANSGLRFTCNYNSMGKTTVNSTVYTCFHSGNGPTYTITAPSGYYIGGYEMSLFGQTGQYVKPSQYAERVSISTDADNPTHIVVTDINASTTTMQRTGDSNGWAYIKSFTVYLIPYYTVTYNIVDGSNNLLKTQSETVLKGTVITDIPSLLKRAYCTYSSVSETITADATLNVTCTYSGGPFEFASSVEDAENNNKWKEFKLYNNNFVYYNGTKLAYDYPDLSTANGYQWAIIGNPYGYKLYNRGAEGFLNASVPTTNNATTSDFTFDATGLTFELYKYQGKSGDSDHFVSVVQGTNTNEHTATVLNYSGSSWKIWCGLNNSGFECNNGLMNGLSQSYLLPMDVPSTFTVTYNVIDANSNQLATADIEVAAGDTGSDAAGHMPSALNRAGCTYTYSPATVSETNNVITVSYNYDLGRGFDVYDNYSNIMTWYFLKRNDTDYIVYDNTATPNVVRSTDLPDGDDASWAFVGNPYQGFKIYNKGAGSGMWLVSSTPSTSDEGASATVSLGSSGEVESWFLSGSGYFSSTGIFIGNSDGYKLNGRQGQTAVCYWTGGANGGSTFVTLPNGDYSVKVANELGAWFSSNVGNYFGLSQATCDAQQANYTSYSSTATYKQYMELTAAVKAGIVYPATGTYRIRNNYAEYANNTGLNYMNTTNGGLASVTNTTGEGLDVVLRLTNNGNGTYYIQAQGDYLQTPAQSSQVVRSTTPVAFTPIISSPGVVAWQAGNGQYGALHRASDNSLVGWSANAAASQWTIEDAPATLPVALHTIGDVSYATLCVPFAFTIDGATAYTLEKNGDYLVPTAITGVVPAGTPVLLKGTTSSATLTISGTDYVVSPLTTTALTGIFVAATLGSDNYSLGQDDEGVVGFYHWSGTMAANRAYLSASTAAGANSLAIVWDEVTGIKNIEQQANLQQQTYYTLDGRKLNGTPAKAGIYIVNGKKVAIK